MILNILSVKEEVSSLDECAVSDSNESQADTHWVLEWNALHSRSLRDGMVFLGKWLINPFAQSLFAISYMPFTIKGGILLPR